jgi:hypothetical protein
MKFNSITFIMSIAVLCVTALYVLLYSGVAGLLLTSAIALLIAAFVEQFELVVAITVIFALFYTVYLKRVLAQFEGFEDAPKMPDESKGDEESKDTAAHKGQTGPTGPTGVYDPKVDGFADVKETKDKKEGAGKESAPASANNTKDQVDPSLAKDVTTASKDKFKDIEAAEFKSATNTLFKLGQMPSEHEDGPRLDAGKTIMKAMSSFDPSTISAMTTDTKKLLETQKGLMSMLNQMRPVLADGKELLQTFSGMFGGMGSANGPFELGKA